MLENLKEGLIDLGKSLKDTFYKPFDPTVFNHPVALETEWSPLKGGGTNFRTHRLLVNAERARFIPTLGYLLFASIFIAAGLFIISFNFHGEYMHDAESNNTMIIIFLAGAVFAGAGLFILRGALMPRVFNKTLGFYYRGFLKSHKDPEYSNLKEYCELPEIAAIQLISEYVSSDNSYHSYETNIVLQSGDRMNVVDHGNKRAAIRDAEKLATFLKVPLWKKL